MKFKDIRWKIEIVIEPDENGFMLFILNGAGDILEKIKP